MVGPVVCAQLWDFLDGIDLPTNFHSKNRRITQPSQESPHKWANIEIEKRERESPDAERWSQKAFTWKERVQVLTDQQSEVPSLSPQQDLQVPNLVLSSSQVVSQEFSQEVTLARMALLYILATPLKPLSPSFLLTLIFTPDSCRISHSRRF